MSDTKEELEVCSGSLFVDSGAHSIYNIHVLGSSGKARDGKHGRKLDKAPVRWTQGDFSYFDLTKGSPFRAYCDSYAKFIKHFEGRDIMVANVDAISNPDLTWEVQRFFEEEHGVQPIPIVHCHTPMKYVDRYLEAGRYDLMGVGGLGQGISRNEYFRWGDKFFNHICPESNKYLPVIRTHGFAMTSWELMCRWPWWSVDSATWVKLSAYGWLYVPRWTEDKGFRFDMTPLTINFSFRSPQKAKKDKHYDNAVPSIKLSCDKWLAHCGLGMGTVDEEGKCDEFGVASHHRARSMCNLAYLQDMAQSLPEWPYPLDRKLVEQVAIRYHRGFGL